MEWSRYNLLFESKRNGWLLYNSGSNSFVQINDDIVDFIKELKRSPNMDFSDTPDLYMKLRFAGFLIEDGKDDDLIRILKMRRLTSNYAGNKLSLIIAPTKECNFACKYCYQHNRISSKMSDETENKLIQFVQKHNSITNAYLTWYGGEPLLEFERIKSITKKIAALGLNYHSNMVTNGYCLTPEIIQVLNEHKITTMQITIDGSKETHNKRRFLIGGGDTYSKILENIDALMNSDWDGCLNIRVNIDASNSNEFATIYNFIKERYPDKFIKKITIYPGFVHDDANPDIGCYFNSDAKGNFLIEMAQNHNIKALSIFPQIKLGGCVLTARDAYVVGPDGELYKCWNDVGKERDIIGSINSFTGWNTALIAEGMVGASYLEDEACQKCFFFPVCDGGCPKMRMYNRRDNGKRDTCSYLKNHAKELLEIHYEQKMLIAKQ